ncbi:MAG: dihydroorotate dehydrogenase (quinone) [Acidobacteria bacterium]|nr:MAG: dihydroorotate dehydrogenase (quinone) [Acidobacteriota bacterium]
MYRYTVRPVLFQLDPELIHETASTLISSSLFKPFWKLHYDFYYKAFPELKTRFCGIECEHPIGLAAGFDKNATMFSNMHYLGFSFLEVGTVTGQAQTGNPKPRLFRLPADCGLINRMGFNNAGSAVAAKNLIQKSSPLPVGGNIGKTKVVALGDEAIKDYEVSFLKLRNHIDYLVVNVSSPNTPGLRTLQDKKPLCELLCHLNGLKGDQNLPILLKIAPDLTDQQLIEIVEVVEETGIQGVIATNTTIARDGLKTPKNRVDTIGSGGLSGAPLASVSTRILKFLRRHLPKSVDLIGVGGIFSGEDVLQKLKAGANAVQIYTSFVYRGPSCVFQMKAELSKAMRREGFSSIEEAIGVDV